jgi:hypothetical protein
MIFQIQNAPPGVNNTGSKLTASVNQHLWNIYRYQQQRWSHSFQRFKLIAMTVAANLTPVSIIRWWQIATGANDLGDKFTSIVTNTTDQQRHQYRWSILKLVKIAHEHWVK